VTIANSDTFSHLYYKAAVGCAVYSNPNQCQVLANLCVLQLYDEQTIVCELYKDTVDQASAPRANSFYNDNGWKEGIPWLFYERATDIILYESKRVKMRVSFGYEDPALGI